MFDTSFLDKYTHKTEDKEEVMAFFPEDVPAETPYRETAITAARQIIDELNNLTYDGKTEEDVRAIFHAVAFFAGAATFEMHGVEEDGDGEL
ncbi:MAG: hypothetical protein IKY18_03665 [Oscillospiraceae bacterium]|nr:hypothetical protein [Oscillospiraceae bacterium]